MCNLVTKIIVINTFFWCIDRMLKKCLSVWNLLIIKHFDASNAFECYMSYILSG